MNFETYRKETLRTLPDLGEVQNLCHMTMGIVTEVGEIINCCTSRLYTKIDTVNLQEEFGDMYWYISNYCNLRDIPHPNDVKGDTAHSKVVDTLFVRSTDLLDFSKKLLAYGKPIPRSNEIEAIYDLFECLRTLEKLYHIDKEETLQKNINKLKARYPDKFNAEQAINRDLDKERGILEA
ncbi:MAG: hypothetical protein ACK58U_15980 [Rubrivivax sp.]|jgi:NTP pyrophosphatase (non-canonical NTP hydrolase)